MEIKKHVGFIAVVGRPSAGKSTLINAIIGEKVSIVSSIPQTTRTHIRAIYQDTDTQAIFVDTPGLHISNKKFNRALLKEVHNSLKDKNCILYVIDTTRDFGPEEEQLIEILKHHKEKTVIAFNKSDITDENTQRNFFKNYLNDFDKKNVFSISAKDSSGVDELLECIKKRLPEDNLYYPEDYYTDQPVDLRISEIVREKVFIHTQGEIPHSTYIKIDEIQDDEEKNIRIILGSINTETESQKQIVIGKNGSMIKKISTEARKELEDIFDQKIFLRLQVKVHKKWRNDDKTLKKILHT
jgi:GTP-binding protein Era